MAASTQTLKTFRRDIGLTMQGIVRELYRANTAQISVQSEPVAVRNLTTILEATLTLANKKGFQAMSLRDLAQATGMSLGGLYAYIRSKDDLVALIQTQGRQLVTQVLADQIADVIEPSERLRAAIRAHLYLSEILRAWFYFSYMEAKHLPPVEKRAAQASEIVTEDIFRHIIEAGQATEQFATVDAQMAAALLKAWLQDWYLKRWKYQDRGVDVERYAATVIEMTERMLKP